MQRTTSKGGSMSRKKYLAITTEVSVMLDQRVSPSNKKKKNRKRVESQSSLHMIYTNKPLKRRQAFTESAKELNNLV
jgi:hypothetical protein